MMAFVVLCAQVQTVLLTTHKQFKGIPIIELPFLTCAQELCCADGVLTLGGSTLAEEGFSGEQIMFKRYLIETQVWVCDGLNDTSLRVCECFMEGKSRLLCVSWVRAQLRQRKRRG
jgi:hypothetical protein